MKSLLILCLMIGYWHANAQLSGTVTGDSGEPVEYATIVNITKNHSTITNNSGNFRISGEVGDSLKVQHVNYVTEVFEVKYTDTIYYLSQKNIELDEITVTARYAIDLFRKSCINTFNTLKDDYINKGYLRYTCLSGTDTIQVIDLDLDIVQKKRKSIGKGEKLHTWKIQERNEFLEASQFGIPDPMFININQIYNWATYLNNSYSLKVEDSLQIKLYFFGQLNKIEVAIHKKDTLLSHVSGFSLSPLQALINRQQLRMFWYVKYDYKNGVGYLSKMTDKLFMPDRQDTLRQIELTQNFEIYGTGETKKRPNGRHMSGLWFFSVKNRYNSNFWERDISEDITFDMPDHPGLASVIKHQAQPGQNSKPLLIRSYKIGYRK